MPEELPAPPEKWVCLTFDDGPSKTTPEVLAALDAAYHGSEVKKLLERFSVNKEPEVPKEPEKPKKAENPVPPKKPKPVVPKPAGPEPEEMLCG